MAKTKNRTSHKTKSIKHKNSKILNKKKKIKGKRTEQKYSAETMLQALQAIDQGLSLMKVSESFGIPKSTLYDKYTHRTPVDCKKGPSTVLTADEENYIVQWILYCAERGFPVTKIQLLDCVQKYLTSLERTTPFKNNRPGKYWYNAFMKRHENLSIRVAQNLTSTRASVSEEELRKWFSHVKLYLERKNLLSIPPERIFNLDESSFMLNPQDKSVITEKGSNSVYQIVGNNEKACLTVLFVAAASGIMPPPMILFNSKNTPKKDVLKRIPKGWGVGNSDRGWMDGPSFYSYITNVFFKWLKQHEYTFPIILYVDGHVSHLTLPLCKFCRENQIELIALYPNATHIIQPLDVALFHTLKDVYRTTLRQWRIDNNVVNFKKSMFAEVLNLALESTDFSSSIKNGFKACGLFPFNPDAVNYNILKKKKNKKSSCAASADNKTVIDNESAKNNENQKLLLLFETTLISPESLELFRKNEFAQSWVGEVKEEGLFESWRKLRRLCDNFREEDNVQNDNLISDKSINNTVSLNTSNVQSGITSNDVEGVPRIIGVEVITQKLNIIPKFIEPRSTDLDTILQNSQPLSSPSNREVELVDECGNRTTAIVIATAPMAADGVNETSNIKIYEDEILDLSMNSNYVLDRVNHSNNDEINNNFAPTDVCYEKNISLESTFVADTCENHNLKKINPENSELKSSFVMPNFNLRKNKKVKSSDTPPVAVVDDLLTVLQEKEDEKNLREQQILQNKEKREKTKIKKEKEQKIDKDLKASKKELMQMKKNINSEIKEIKKSLKLEPSKVKKEELLKEHKNLINGLESIDKLIIAQEMQALSQKMQIKQEDV